MMRHRMFAPALAFCLLLPLVACDDDDTIEPDVSERFTATLTGASEIPVRTTTASGTAVFEVNGAGTAMTYTLTVNNISGMTMSHIHTGLTTENGPIVVFLLGPHGAPGVTTTGQIVKTGVITAADVNPANFTGTFAAFLQALRSGGAYVNVHTTTFTGGEIRGQLAVAP
jgi:hypothetical protein